MSEALKCKGIILKNHRLNDNDKIIHIISDHFGSLRAVAKSAYKINSKNGPKTQVLQYAEFLLAKGRHLDIVQEIKLLQQFSQLQKDFDLLTVAYFFCEITDLVSLEGDLKTFDYFDLLQRSLNILNQEQKLTKLQVHSLIIDFLWKVTCAQGYKPELNICFQTQKKRSQNQIPQYFDFENGSIISEKAYFELLKTNPYENSIHVFQAGVFKILEKLNDDIELVDLDLLSLQAVIKFLYKHLEFCINKEFKTWKTLAEFLETELEDPLKNPTPSISQP
jgi:DNA repair protein RecO